MAEPSVEKLVCWHAEEHKKHLCFLMSEGFHYEHPDEYREMVQDAHYRCQNCPRTAKCAENLCMPIEL